MHFRKRGRDRLAVTANGAESWLPTINSSGEGRTRDAFAMDGEMKRTRMVKAEGGLLALGRRKEEEKEEMEEKRMDGRRPKQFAHSGLPLCTTQTSYPAPGRPAALVQFSRRVDHLRPLSNKAEDGRGPGDDSVRRTVHDCQPAPRG